MGGLYDLLGGLADLLWSIGKFLIDVILDLVYVVGLLGSLMVRIPDMIGWLPGTCISLTVTVFTIVLIYKILGREG